jgi:hypothetical protein
MVSAPDGTPAYWIVPFYLGARACGFARIDLMGRVSGVATFGSGPADSANWPEVAFFERPPAALVTDARTRYRDLKLERASLSYDGNPSKWGWRIESGQDDRTLVFITPAGWYARGPRDGPDAAREG